MPSSSVADAAVDCEVVVVGGGPAGCSAGVFTARYGLDTLVFDRGNAALPRCASLENYLGFPGGIDVEVFRDLMRTHAETAGCEIVPEMVVSVERADEGRFAVETGDGRRVLTEHVLAAAWYDGSYLRPLDEDAMFETHEHHGELEERFDPEYPDEDGRTPVDGLYVASPAGGRSAQAIVAAGNGAHVARSLIEDRRRERGYSGGTAPHYDWLRSASEFSGEWENRDRWREWFENEFADDHDLDPDRFEELRETYIDQAFETQVTPEEAENRSERGLRQLVETIGTDRILGAVDDEAIRDHLHGSSSREQE
ncbi:FAD-dependent monooxygenase [Haloparvum sp. PAK95]|uniref:FAD-dependent monooxygenase n=1 Tax=Haloparvum sp. PAK95 TaxID=3418962 RepID=UPI003D2F0EC2